MARCCRTELGWVVGVVGGWTEWGVLGAGVYVLRKQEPVYVCHPVNFLYYDFYISQGIFRNVSRQIQFFQMPNFAFAALLDRAKSKYVFSTEKTRTEK